MAQHPLALGDAADHAHVVGVDGPIEARGVRSAVQPADAVVEVPFAVCQLLEVSGWIKVHRIDASQASEHALRPEASDHAAFSEVVRHCRLHHLRWDYSG